MNERSTRRRTPPGWPCAHAGGPELAAGTIVGDGRFVVGAVLGHGGMATVYRGHDRRLRHDVALKVMHHAARPDARPGARPDARVDARSGARARRFEHEAGLLARLPEHPGLVRLLHAGRLPELAQRPFLTTEAITGPTLAFRMAADLRMPVGRAVALGAGLARALVAVHGVGVVHRDLTARNVMLHDGGEDAWPIIVDFGLAAVAEPPPGSSRLTQPDQRPGTVTAMAPEQFRGRPPHPAMDVYALGRLLYEMLTAEDPHASVSHADLLERHRDGARVAPRLVGRGEVGTMELRALVDACLEPEPRLRPTTADAAAELRALGRALARGATVLPFRAAGEGSAIVGPPVSTSWTAVAARPVRRWERSIASLAIVVTGTVLGISVWCQRIPTAASSDAGEIEPAVLAWPSTVVPMGAPRVGSNGALEVASEPVGPTLGASSEVVDVQLRRAAAPTRARSSRVHPHASPCVDQRERARAAARRWAWSEVLEATSTPACWLDGEGERTRLRLVAWIEQRRFDACEEEGARVRDPELVRLVERCRRRRAPRVAAPRPLLGGGGSP